MNNTVKKVLFGAAIVVTGGLVAVPKLVRAAKNKKEQLTSEETGLLHKKGSNDYTYSVIKED